MEEREEEVSASGSLDAILNGTFKYDDSTEEENEEFDYEEEDDIEDTDEKFEDGYEDDTNDDDADQNQETLEESDEDSNEENAQEDDEESDKDESEDEESEDGADDESNDKSEEGNEEEDNGLDNTESDTKTKTNEPNADFYKSFFDKVTSEFKANGKTVKGFSDPEKIIKAQQMLYGFEEKMAGFKKYRPLMSALEKSGMIENHDKFNLMMDVMNGDREALKHFISINKIDPIVDLDLDDIKYIGANYVESDEAINIKETLAAARELGIEDTVRDVVGNKWDAESFKEFSKKPKVREDLLYHMTNKLNESDTHTIYDAVQDKIKELSLLDVSGAFRSKTSINQYREAAAILAEEIKAKNDTVQKSQVEAKSNAEVKPESKSTQKQSVDKAAVEAAKAKIEEDRKKKEYADKLKAKELEVAEKRKKASAASKPKPKVVDEKPKFDPLKLTGKEFFEYMDSLGKS